MTSGPVAGETSHIPTETDVLVVGAGPAGSAAAIWAARRGYGVVLADAAVFPRDKTCGDGLTPRAIGELELLGLGDWIRERGVHRGVRLCGWRREVEFDWPGGSLPTISSAVPRIELDDKIRTTAVKVGAHMVEGAKAVRANRVDGRVQSVTFQTVGGDRTIACKTLVIADGVRSTLGKQLGRTWHRDTPYGVAVRAYVKSGRHDDPFITTYSELRDDSRKLRPGYGWVFPLSTGEVNIGLGYLATDKRPAHVALKPLLDSLVRQRRQDWQFDGPVHSVTSALLPLGGSVSTVAGPNWALLGDAAGCINPLNGEGIDYGLEAGRFLADLLGESDLTDAWPHLLRAHYGKAFSVGRRIAWLSMLPGVLALSGPPLLWSKILGRISIRVLGNLVTDEDVDLVARAWRTAGRGSLVLDRRAPFE
ncbi:geranylgeranyl reductase family protein [Antrihabitans stalactiti]|uniref:Geranylgeranyl reductase family protein n=1 Tax=Antrihabitans stalactiti TaxID=2584121 RepID=A0A848KHG3_9NOCA|nr:geranylgeranyl reductase family protein [Antrihabitans stalactiti]NMN96152.1 geranylgeranyl reductase family protein [Antrihabitans stalactiti]